jgi:Ser/Thr protein kinase RdoA (MazF antagonist)
MKRYKRNDLTESWFKLKITDMKRMAKKYGITEIKKITKLHGGAVNLNLKISAVNKTYVLRIYRYKSRPNIETELNLIDFLREKQFPIPHYFNDESGNRIQTFDSYLGVLFEFVNGIKVQEGRITVNHIREIGALLGKLHSLTKNYFQGRNRWNGDPESIKRLYLTRKIEIEKVCPELYQKTKKYLDILLMIEKGFDIPKGLVHSDIRIDNIIFSEQGKILCLLDFDNFYHGYLLTDLVTAIYFCCFERDKLNKRKMKALISFYQEHRILTAEENGLITVFLNFVILKHIFYGNLICVEGNQKLGWKFAHQGVNRFRNLSN